MEALAAAVVFCGGLRLSNFFFDVGNPLYLIPPKKELPPFFEMKVFLAGLNDFLAYLGRVWAGWFVP